MSHTISLVIVPKSPRTKTDEELAVSCGAALADAEAIEFAEYELGAWINEALLSDITTHRNKAVAAVFSVYGARLELTRLEVLGDRLLEDLEKEQQHAIRELSGFDRNDRPRLACALFELGRLQRAEQDERRRRFDEVRLHALERESALRTRVGPGPSGINRGRDWRE